jgi:antibiotic biosynthesis monooxygenase (ABM) superfamily enzyme
VTAVVRRRIKSGSEARFESLMQEFVPFVLRQPGHLGINVIRLSPGSRAYTVLDRFATENDRYRFTASPEYRDWMSKLRDVSEETPEIDEMGGLAFWFIRPWPPPRKPPPKLKMALLILLSALPLSMLLPMPVILMTPSWPDWIQGAAIIALIVASLTWIIMPVLTRIFEKWLFPAQE